VEEVVSRPLIISLQTLPKLSFSNTSNKKHQETKSNAFVMSNLSKILGCFTSAGALSFIVQA
jgi:hypothetical protein